MKWNLERSRNGAVVLLVVLIGFQWRECPRGANAQAAPPERPIWETYGESFGLLKYSDSPEWLNTPDGVAVCIDPSGVFVSGGLPMGEPKELAFHTRIAMRQFEIGSAQEFDECTIIRSSAADIPAIALGPKEPFPQTLQWDGPTVDVRLVIPNIPPAHGPSPTVRVPLVREEKCRLHWSRFNGSLKGEFVAQPGREIPSKAFVISTDGRLLGVTGRAVSAPKFIPFEFLQFAFQRDRDTNGIDFSGMPKPVVAKVPATRQFSRRLLIAAGAVGLLDASKSSAGVSVVCIDPTGYFIAPAFMNNGESLLPAHGIQVRGPDGALQRGSATIISKDAATGLTLLKVDVPYLLPFVPLADTSGQRGAIWATAIAIDQAHLADSSASTQYKSRRGQLTWGEGQPSISRTGSDQTLHGAAVLDDAGGLLGIVNYGIHPDAMGAMLASSINALFKKPLLTSCFNSSVDPSVAEKPRNFDFRVLGLGPGHSLSVQFILDAGSAHERSASPQEIEPSHFQLSMKPSLAPAVTRASIPWRAQLRVDGELVDSTTGSLIVTDSGAGIAGASAGGAGPRISRSDTETVSHHVIKLPGRPTRGVVAGNGRYLVTPAFSNGKRLLVVLDVGTLTIHQAPLPNKVGIVAGGAEHIVVCSAEKLERWDLATLKPETSVPMHLDQEPLDVAMGSGSAGPVVIRTNEGVRLYDLKSLRQLEKDATNALADVPEENRMHISADGRIIGVSVESGFGKSLVGEIVDGRHIVWKPYEFPHFAAIPDPDGYRLFAGRRAIASSGNKDPQPETSSAGVPAVDVTGFSCGASVGTGRAVFDDQTQEAVAPLPLGRQSIPLKAADCFFFANVGRFVAFSVGAQTATVWDITLDDGIARSESDYFYVRSVPVRAARARSIYEYTPVIRTAQIGAVIVTLAKGPAGMTVGNGTVNWSVPSNFHGHVEPVTLRCVNSAGKELLHSFWISVY